MGEITKMIKQIAQKDQPIQTFAAKVTRINKEGNDSLHDQKDAYTVDVVRADGAEIRNVRLKASIQDKEQGIIILPKEESWVLVSIIEATETRAFISQYSEIDRVYLRLKSGSANQGDERYFQTEIDPSNFQMLFKEKNSGSTSSPTYKDVAQIEFKDDKSLQMQFFNEDQEAKPVVKATFNDSNVQFSFNDTDGETLLQQTTFDKDKVKVILSEGFEATITKDLVKISKDDLHLELKEKFKVAAGGTDLKTAVTDLINAIKALTVTTPSGPSGTPINASQFMQVQNTFDQILE